MENPIKMDDLGVPLFLETPIYKTPELILTVKPVVLWKYRLGEHGKNPLFESVTVVGV